MKKISFRARLQLLIVLTLLLITLVTFAVGKYKSTVSFDGSFTFTASLADKMILQEHVAERKTNGSYQLGAAVVNGNTYKLIPGLDIPKDPHIIIEGKTPIQAYLYLEVVDTLDTVTVGSNSVKLVNYALTDDWEQVTKTPICGAANATVYRYKTMLKADVPNAIYILKDNMVTVSQYVKSYDYTAGSDTDVLEFYAYLEETTEP